MVTPSPSRSLTVMPKKQNAKRTKKDNTDCSLLLLSSPDKHSSYSRYYRFCCGSNTSGGLTSFFGYNLRYNLLSSEPASSLSLLLCSIAFFILSIARIFQKSSNFLKFSIIFSFFRICPADRQTSLFGMAFGTARIFQIICISQIACISQIDSRSSMEICLRMQLSCSAA